MNIGQAIKQLRDKRHMSIEELHLRTGYPKSLIKKVENNEHIPSVNMAQRLLNVLEAKLFIKED